MSWVGDNMKKVCFSKNSEIWNFVLDFEEKIMDNV